LEKNFAAALVKLGLQAWPTRKPNFRGRFTLPFAVLARL